MGDKQWSNSVSLRRAAITIGLALRACPEVLRYICLHCLTVRRKVAEPLPKKLFSQTLGGLWRRAWPCPWTANENACRQYSPGINGVPRPQKELPMVRV